MHSNDLPANRYADDAKFAAILDIAADAIISVDNDQRIVHFNKGAEQVFGYIATEIIGKSLSIILPSRFHSVHGDHMHRFAQGADTARRMGERREIFGLRRGGVEFPAEASISKLETPGGRLFTVVLRDISDRKRAEWEHHILAGMSEQLSRSIDYDATVQSVVNSPVPELADACVLDLMEADRTLFRTLSQAATPALKFAIEKLSQGGSLDWDSPSRVIDVIRTCRPELVPMVTEEWIDVHTDSSDIVKEAWRTLKGGSVMMIPLIVRGESIGALTLMRDPDHNAYTDADLLFAQECAQRLTVAVENARLYRAARAATRARDELLSIVSHELRNPISAVSMCGHVLRDNASDNPAMRKQLAEAIISGSAWMNRLIQDLLDVSIMEARRLSIWQQPEELATIITSAMEMVEGVAKEKGIIVSFSGLPSIPKVEVDSSRIIQVLTNILGNAVKFTPRDGTIAIEASVDQWIATISVVDSGPGISLPDRAKVFEQFWQGRTGSEGRGSGLGLAIAKGIVEAHGGRIWVEEAPAGGSKFSFTLQLATPATDDAIR